MFFLVLQKYYYLIYFRFFRYFYYYWMIYFLFLLFFKIFSIFSSISLILFLISFSNKLLFPNSFPLYFSEWISSIFGDSIDVNFISFFSLSLLCFSLVESFNVFICICNCAKFPLVSFAFLLIVFISIFISPILSYKKQILSFNCLLLSENVLFLL